jgi:hypothetical protein
MVRQWCVVVTALAVMIGSATAAADVASASSLLSLAATARAVTPGHPMVRPGGLTVPSARDTAGNSEIGSTNWSGYAVSGSDGAYRSVAASWVVRFTAARVNGKALKKLHPIKIVMIDGGGLAKDSTSVFSTAGAFHNTWIRSS